MKRDTWGTIKKLRQEVGYGPMTDEERRAGIARIQAYERHERELQRARQAWLSTRLGMLHTAHRNAILLANRLFEQAWSRAHSRAEAQAHPAFAAGQFWARVAERAHRKYVQRYTRLDAFRRA